MVPWLRTLLFTIVLCSIPVLGANDTEGTMDLWFITLEGCHDCEDFQFDVLLPLVRSLEAEGREVNLVELDVLESDAFERVLELQEDLGFEYRGTPALVVASGSRWARYFYGNQLSLSYLETAIQEQLPPVPSPESTAGAVDLGPWAIFAAGLIDGINPCAISTLLFMLAALSVGGRTKGAIALTGSGFTLGVFLCYLAVGMGLLRSASALGVPSWVSDLVTAISIGALTVLAVLSIVDGAKLYRRSRMAHSHGTKGARPSISLKLPTKIKRFMGRLMRTRAGLWGGFFGALALGVILSLLEFVCTGQVYLPTLVYMFRTNPGSSLPLLILYNLAFVLPLIIVFALVLGGTSQRQLVAWAEKHAASSKFLLGAVFLILALIMVLIL